MYSLSQKSKQKLEGLHPDLVSVVELAISLSTIDFTVTEGMRTIERQRKLFAAGASRTMNSRHLSGKAVDLAAYVDGEIRWDWPLYPIIASAMKKAADQLGISIVWGGDWESFRDGPHFELDRRVYS